jgi:integrase
MGRFCEVEGVALKAVDSKVVRAFEKHLPACRCPQSNGGTTSDVGRGARLFLGYLREIGGLQVAGAEENRASEPELVRAFKDWLRQERGVSESTQYRYGRGAIQLVCSVGDDPSKYDAESLRSFVLKSANQMGPGAIKSLLPGLRMFLRYLGSQGACPSGLERAIPAIAGWNQTPLPAFLQASEVQRIIEGCEATSLLGIRDRAILLLLARVGLRAGDVAALRLSDIDWVDGSFLVSGKGRCEVRLPLPQEVGDALLKYLEQRPDVNEAQVFLRAVAPLRPFRSGSSVSRLVAKRIRAAGVVAPCYGAHLLRHTAATEMLRQGVPLYEIGAVLRHRSRDMTAYYAQVDLELLKQVTQPWPEVLSC